MWKAMELAVEKFTGTRWTEIGPMLITQAVKTLYNSAITEDVKTKNLTILPLNTFYPIEWFDIHSLWPFTRKSCSDWSRIFENSSQVHFFGHLTSRWFVEHDPSHEAYGALGPKYCPISIWSSDNF